MMHARLFKIVEANACVEVAVVKEDGADSAAGANDLRSRRKAARRSTVPIHVSPQTLTVVVMEEFDNLLLA